MSTSPTIVLSKLDDEQLKKSIADLVSNFDTQMLAMEKRASTAIDNINKTLKGLGSATTNGSTSSNTSKQVKEQERVTKAVNESTVQLDQMAKAGQQAMAQSAQASEKYTEQLRKQADAIRATREWQERGFVTVGNTVYTNPEKANVSNAYRKTMLSLEEQIYQAQEKQAMAQQRETAATQETAGVKQRVISEAERQLQIEGSIAEVLQKSRDVLRGMAAQGGASIATFTPQLESMNRLTTKLKDLRKQYDSMTFGERFSEGGQKVARNIREITRQLQKVNSELARPINFAEIKGLSTKTLDDIAYKMRQLQAYKGGLNLSTQADEIRKVNKEYDKLRREQLKYMSDAQTMTGINNALGRSWNYMKNRLAFYFTVGASMQFFKNLVQIRSEYEMNERALGILIDSAERGTQIFNELSQMALVSPYTLIELSTAAKQLTAYDVAARDVVDTTRRLADMASAVGIPIERLTYALGQIKAYGYLNSRDARMFANAGIPLVKQLSEYYTEMEGRLVSTADVYDRIKKKAIDYNEVMEVINKMTDEGGKFFDFQAKMADTLKVRLANLTLAWNNMLNDIGKDSQGFLTWGIGALRDLFLHWKQFNALIKNAAWAGSLIIAFRALNVWLVKSGVQWRILSKEMTTAGIAGSTLANRLAIAKNSLIQLVKTPLTWWSLLALVAVEATQAITGTNEAQKNLNDSIRKGAKDNYDNISKYLEQYQKVRQELYKKEATNGGKGYRIVSQDIDDNQAKKVWETMREQIELTVASSGKYVGQLLAIENVSERLRQGFALLNDIQVVNAALKELDDNTIKISQDWSGWWNLWVLPDGLIENLGDVADEENRILQNYKSVEEARGSESAWAEQAVKDYDNALKTFRENLEKTTQSIINFIELKGWSGDEGKINQVFEQISQKLTLDNNLDPQKAFALQVEIEEARSKAAKQALWQRINDERAALKISHDDSVREALAADRERYINWDETNGRSKVEWERFTKWMKEQHISEMTAMFRGMDAEDIKSLNFREGKYGEYVKRMVTQYAKEHKMSYDEAFGYLRSWVTNANQWSVYIPLTISTEKEKSVFDTLGELDKQIDDSDAKIKRLKTRIDELTKKGVRGLTKDESEELKKATQELSDAEKAKAEAEAKGGHGKQEEKDRKKNAKERKQAESELQKALKEELGLIDKVRSAYKRLTQEGVDSAAALKESTSGFDETVNAINKTFGRFGLKPLNLKSFAGISNPRAVMDMLQAQLNKLMSSGVAKTSEIKDLQVKIRDLRLDVISFDQKTITDSLNNELGKLKDEYELAIALDADPEMGNLFADMWGVDMSALPHTAKEYAKRLTASLNKYLKEANTGIEVDDLLKISDDDLSFLDDLLASDMISQQAYDNIVKDIKIVREAYTKETSGLAKEWNSLVEKYGGLQAKLTKITKETATELVAIIKKFGDKTQKMEALKLQYQLSVETDPETAKEISQDINKIAQDVIKNNPHATDITEAIFNKGDKDAAKAEWDKFKQGDMYVKMFEDMENHSNRSIQNMLDKLNELKDKVKEDPASMKEVVKDIEKMEEMLGQRNPTQGFVQGLALLRSGYEKVRDAKQKLAEADKEIADAEQDQETAETAGNAKMLADAEKRLADAKKRRKQAQDQLNEGEDEEQKGLNKMTGALKNTASKMEAVASVGNTVAGIFREMGDEDTAEGIEAIMKGFTMMSTILTTVATLIVMVQTELMVLQTSVPWLTAIAAALAVIVGLVSFLSGQDNKRIDKEISDSELAVKRLENAYKELERTIEHTYGTATMGAQRVAIANKKMQLTELKRQLLLENSRSGKKYDAEKVEDLRGQIIDLENEIADAVENITNNILGISSVGDAMDSLMDGFIDALRSGEDAMESFDKSIKEMIINMVKKMVVSKFIQPWFDKNWKDTEALLNAKVNKTDVDRMAVLQSAESFWKHHAEDDELAEMIRYINRFGYSDYDVSMMRLEEAKKLAKEATGDENNWGNYFDQALVDVFNKYRQANLKEIEQRQAKIAKDSMLTESDLDKAVDIWSTDDLNLESLQDFVDRIMERFGLKDADKTLSSLQQGISSITEETAGALEAIINGISQQSYYQSEVLTQIRDAVIGFNLDAQLSVNSQMLLQLQNNYVVMQTMQSMMESWTVPSGQGIRVELMN